VTTVTTNRPTPLLRVAPLPLPLEHPERPARPARPAPTALAWTPLRSAASTVAKCELPPGGRWVTGFFGNVFCFGNQFFGEKKLHQTFGRGDSKRDVDDVG